MQTNVRQRRSPHVVMMSCLPAASEVDVCVCACVPDDLPDGNGACCADWASAGPRTPPSSSPQSWDPRAPGQKREDDTLLQSLNVPKQQS